MSDYFRDQLSTLDANVSSLGKSIGGWDIHNKQYILSLQPSDGAYSTLAFDDNVNGFPSFFSFKPDQSVSLKNNFYTMKDGVLYLHHSSRAKRGNFYGVQYSSNITFVFNPKVSMSKVFKTVNYEGSNGWQINSFASDLTGVNTPNTINSAANNQDTTVQVYSYNQGSYDNLGNEYGDGTTRLIPPINHAGFTRKENKYMANLINNSPASAGEVELQNNTDLAKAGYAWGASMTGIKGYFATVTASTDSVTDPGGMKELFAVSSQYVESSY